MRRRSTLWVLVGLALLIFAALAIWRTAGSTSSRPAPASAGALPGQTGGGFHLVDQTGRPVDQSILKGKWTAVFFGYTFCPDVCPMTLQTLGSASQDLGPRAKDFQVVFVTVDPERDTPAKLKDYLSSAAFPRHTIGLTGTPDQIAAIALAYGVFYQKEGSGAGYAVDHSSAIYLMNPDGAYDSVIAFGLTPEETRAQILKAMRQGAAS
jgi:protein SCO1/2